MLFGIKKAQKSQIDHFQPGIDVMKSTINIGYWGSIITQIRSSLNLSQEAFAESVFSNQATVSRWEKGIVIPTYDKQKKIEILAAQAGLASLGGLVEVVRHSPSRMLIVDETDFVIASSSSSEWHDNQNVLDQISDAAMPAYRELKKNYKRAGFLDRSGRGKD
jgi:transcriptional regulator with XRE-family HTH domain